MENNLKCKEAKLEKTETYKKSNKNIKYKNHNKEPSAVDDCADIKSKYSRYNHEDFDPINYEKPPHY
jgi:hypothetical protein